MCGIFAYLNYNVSRERRYIMELLFNGLRRLEYRGYDSAGISIDLHPTMDSHCSEFQPTLSSPLVFRQAGKIDHLVKSVYQEVDASDLNMEESFTNHLGIAHTRWATHGPPSSRNSHPQSSGKDHEFLVVHNGIITNYVVLKETLLRHGFVFESDTDTEVIPKLAKFVFDTLTEQKIKDGNNSEQVPFRQIVMEVMSHLEGAYALIFKSPHYPNEVVACKRGSPLLLGVKEVAEDGSRGASFNGKFIKKTEDGKPKEFYFASDPSALVEHTRQVMILEDNDVAHIKDGDVSVYKFDFGKAKTIGGLARPASVHRALSILEMEVEQIKKGNYEHFMQKEIHEQPESLTTTMRGRLIRGGDSKLKGVLLGGLKDYMWTIRHCRRIVFIGCGTSYNAALASRAIVEELSGIPVTMEIASDLLDRQGPIYREDTAVFVSQSGETADTLLALEYALKKGALCVGITNTVGSAIARKTHCGVHINAGCEIGVASTKAYTSQIAVMAMLALAVGDDSISSQGRRDIILDGFFDLPNKVREVLKLDSEMKELAKLLMDEQSLLVFGRGYNYATALEGALKVKEVALMHSEGILAGEMKHGPLALVDETLPIIVIATHDSCFGKQQSVIQQLEARKGRLIVMCSKGEASLVSPNGASRVIEVPQVDDCLQPIINIVPFQLLAYHLTVLRGYDVDQPRNLAKSVTTE
ncbi:hypothetical protein SUGI_0025820 [Cryptomeria japonica]|uniref:glutamine--fructose-6-phosphate aminotransferase [isomerizing] 1 n=1 Tax=Cryptomeria japonica TaxID=3369 RepID=UPI002408AEA4|nr:glutamine--fructose-6-phosphate aminotransferase [isomerizing] 1 [Cryptomeria japonica]GLJ05808.1 hypothetical protein SUGI_0025820 [Cryptomeria japonica]